MAATPQNVEMEAAKFLHKLIQESTDEPTKLATKLHVILQHMRSSGKENSMPYQVISRAMETVINRHGLDIDALMSSRQPLTGGTQAGDSSLTQIAGPQQTAMESDSKKTLTTEDTTKIAAFSGKPLHGPSSAGHDIYQGSANQLNPIKNHGANAGVSGSYESTEPGNLMNMQFSNSYDNQGATTLMHKDRRVETFSTPTLSDLTSGKGPAGKALEHEGGFPNVMGNVSKTVQGGISSNITEMAILRNEAPRDTGKSPVVLQTPSAGPSTPFKEHHLKQLRAQCLVFLAFRNNLMPKKLHLDIALGNFFPKEDISGKEHIDQKGKEQSIGGQSVSHEVVMPSARKTERIGSGLSGTSFISEPNLLKEGEKLDGMGDKNDPPSGLPEHGEALRNNMIPRKFEAEMQAFETKESQMSVTKVAQPDNFSSQSKSHADSQGNRHGHGNLPSFPLRESWKSHPGMEGNNHEGEDISEPSPSPPSPRYTTSEKWIADFQKRKVAAEHNWTVKKKKMEQRISACAAKLKETVSSSEDISAKTRSVIELKKLELLDLQRRLRNDILHDFFKPISTEMDRLKSIKKNRVGRRSKQLEKYEQKMKEERQKRIRERQKDFFSEMELHKERLEDVFKFRRERAKGFNKYVREFHKRKERLHREKIDRIQREKINLLKINDVEGYLRMVQDAKSDRVKQLLKETEKYLQKLGSKLKEAKVISRCFETETGVSENSEFIIENEDETDQAKHYMESNEKYYMMAHSIKEIVTEQPLSLVGGKLREYQLNGLRWLLSLYNNHLNGILADEMGLGKTVQVISLLCYLMENKNDRGPFLVVVPSSVLPGWETEINFWAPSINKIVYAGPPEERRRLLKERIVQQKFNVLLTTYEYLMNKHDRPKLSKIHWHYVIIDEGHRIKNASCKLNAELKHYHSSHRLLLTGTPLQNNLEELWALLNFLLPNIFNSSEDFSQWFNKPFESNADNSVEEALLSEEENLLIINRLHQVLRPFVLRRLKHKVENQLPEKIERLVRCEASAYQKLLMRRVEDSLGAFGSSKSRAVHNSVVELRNICNHPYLSQLHTEEVHDFLPKHYLPNMIRFCGKLEMLDRLLPKLKATDHRVLLFSTMTRLLDVMEDYLYWKQYKYLRLDGHTCGGDRGALIDQFNKPGSPFFIFLLSIRAGGVGVNLQAADTVIIFDTDWNPQVDLQAQARAHRIGQKKDVLVLRLETVKTVEEQVRASAEHKLGVANQSITAGFFDNNTSAEDRREYLESLLRECKKEEAAPVLNDDALNDLIARSESEIDVFEELDKKRQDDELVVWKNLVSEQEGLSAELIPPLPSRLVTDDELKSFCEAMKAIEVPKPVVMPGIAGKRRSELGNFDTQQYGRGKRAREVRSYEEQWTEDEFEKLCQVEAPDSPKPNEELKEKDLATVTSESGMVTGAESAGLPNIQQFRPSEEFTSQQIKEINPPSKRGRGRPKKKPTYISSSPIGLPAPSVPVPSAARNVMGTVYPLGIQTAPGTQLTTTGPSGSKSIPTDGGQLTVASASASASNATLAVPPGFQATANPPPNFRPTTTSPPGYRPITTPPPGYQPKTTPPGYQQIAPAPPGFQPKIASPAPLPASQASTSHISAPLSTPTPASVSQSTPTLPAGPQSTTAIKCEALVNPSLLSVSQSNTALHSSSVPNSNLPPSTQFPTLPDVSVSLPVLSTSSADSQSPISPVVTPGRGRGRGRGRPRGRGRGRGQIIESEVGVPQRRGKKGNNVVLGIPGHLTSSPISKPAIGSPVVPATSFETKPEPLVSGSTAVNAVSVTPPPGIVGTPVIVPPPGTPRSDITSPRLSDPTTPIVPPPVTPKSNILTGIGETALHPDVGTTQMMPPSVSVVSQSTELGALSSQPPTPLVTVPLGTPSASVSSSASKQGRGRGRKAQCGSGAPRRMERKREDIVDDQEKKSNEPPKKKTRVSSGRKTVATRSMSRNEANKSPNDASTTDVDCSQGSKLTEQSQNASTDEKERSSTLVKTDVLTKFDDASKVDDNVNSHAEKVVEPNDISVATEAGSKTHEAIEKTEPKEELNLKILTNLEGERESKSETLETRESKPSKEVANSKKTEVFKAETKHEETDTECNALEDTGKESKTEVGAENELSIQKKTEEKAQAINDGGTMEVMEANPAEETDVAVCGASEVVQGGACVLVVDKENVVENAEDPIVTVHQCETERPGITSGDSPLETEAASSEKFEEIHQGGIENEEKEQEANDPIDMDDTGKTSTGLDFAQGEGDGLVSTEGGDLEEKGAISSNEAMDALQVEAECDKRPLEASGVSGDVGMKLSEDENIPDDPPVEKGEREDLDIDGGTHVMTEDKLSEKVKAISHEKVEDAFQEETEHEKLGGVDGVVENVIDDVNTSREFLVVPTVQGGREGVEKSDGGSLVDTDVKPFEEAGNAPEGESGHEKQEMGRSDASGGVKENVTEDGQTTIVLPVILGGREDRGNTDGSTEGEVDAKSCEKTETENEDVVGGIEKDVDEDEESIKELPAAQEEEKEVSEKDNEELQGETVIEAKEKTDVAPLGQVEEREVSEKDNEELQGETVIEAKETTDVAPLGQEEEIEVSEKDNDELQGQAVIESKQKTDGASLGQDERGNLDIMDTEKPIESVNESVQVENESKGEDIDVKSSSDKVDDNPLEGKTEEANKSSQEAEEASEGRKDETEEVNKSSQEAERKAVEECGHDVIQVTIEEDVAYDAKHSSDKPEAPPPATTAAAEAHDDDGDSSTKEPSGNVNNELVKTEAAKPCKTVINQDEDAAAYQ